jgi:hypothetical protein
MPQGACSALMGNRGEPIGFGLPGAQSVIKGDSRAPARRQGDFRRSDRALSFGLWLLWATTHDQHC